MTLTGRWWESYEDMMPAAMGRLLSREGEAVSIRTYESSVIPGLLQTPEYARAVMHARCPTDPPELVERGMTVRMTRQAVLRGEQPPAYHALLDEAALRHTVGSLQIMAAQYADLLAMAERPHVALQVVPFGAVGAGFPSFPFVIVDFADPAEPAAVFGETVHDALWATDPATVARYVEEWVTVVAHALPPAESTGLIRSLRSGG